MSEHISREEAIAFFKDMNECTYGNLEAVEMAISALSADVRPNIHGHWEVVSLGYGDNAYICECSECKDTVWVYVDADRKFNFCPNCGADMREPKGKKGEI